MEEYPIAELMDKREKMGLEGCAALLRGKCIGELVDLYRGSCC
jgi:hypothetical protein